MANYQATLDLLRYKNAAITEIQGQNSKKLCVVIPVEDNDVQLVSDQQTGATTGARVYLNVWERKTESKYGDTHFFKPSYSKRFRKENPEAVSNSPILGDFRPMKTKTEETPAQNARTGQTTMPF